MSIAWFIIITFLIIGLQVVVYRYASLTDVSYRRTFSETVVFTGDQIEMTDELSNKKLLPLPWIRLETRLHRNLQFEKTGDFKDDNLELHRALFSLAPYQRVRRRQSFTCTQRGHYKFSVVHLTSGDPFGFLKTSQQLDEPGEILVFPRFLEITDFPLPAQSWLGDVLVRRWIMEDPFITAGAREYVPGDALNMIDWQATARTNQLQVAKHDYTADHHVMIYVNFNQSGDVWRPILDEALIEQSLSYAATVASYVISKGVSAGFACNSYVTDRSEATIRIEPESNHQHLMYLLEVMAKLTVDANKSIVTFLAEDIEAGVTGKDIFLITAIRTPEMEDSIRVLEQRGNVVEVLVLDSDVIQEYIFTRGK